MSNKQFLNEQIDILNISAKTFSILKNNKLNKIEDVWKLKRKNLKEMGISETEIIRIIVFLQLQGYDLNQKIYIK